MKKIMNEKMLSVGLGNGTLKDLEENVRLAAFEYYKQYTQKDIEELGSNALLKFRDNVSQKYVSIDLIQKTRPSYYTRHRRSIVIKKILFELKDDLSLVKLDEDKANEVLEKNSIKSYNQIFQIPMYFEEDLNAVIDEENIEDYKFSYKLGKNFDINDITHYTNSYTDNYDKLYSFIAPVVINSDKKEILLQQFNFRGYVDMPTEPMSPSEAINYVLSNKIIKFNKVLEITSSQEDRMSFEYPFIGFVYTEKHKGRFVAPENGLYQAHKAPAKIIENFKSVFPEILMLDEVKTSLEFIEGVNSENIEDGFDVLEAIKSCTPSKEKTLRRSGAHRFTPLLISDRKLLQNSLSDFYESILEVPFNRLHSTANYLDSNKVEYGKKLEIDGVEINVDLSKETITCPKCNDSVDYTFIGEIRAEKRNLEEIKCSCGFIDTPAESFISSPENKNYIFIDKDDKGKIIIRSVCLDINRRYWEEDNIDLGVQIQRVIVYTKNSTLSPTYYDYTANVTLNSGDLYDVEKTMNKIEKEIEEGDSSLDLLNFKTVSNKHYFFNKGYKARNIIVQDKMDILKAIDNTDYKYSGIEDFIFSKTINKDFISTLSIVDYLSIYKEFDGLEKIARIEDIHPLLIDILNTSIENMRSYLDLFNTRTIKDILKLTSEQYSTFLNTNKTREDLLVCQKIENQEEYNFIHDNNVSTYTLSVIKDIAEFINKKTSTVCDYLIRVDVYQAIEPETSTGLLIDYLRMADTLGYDLTSNDVIFPNSLKREHDVAVRDYNNLKYKKYTEEEEIAVIKSLKDFEFKGNNYSIISPKKLEEIREEGNKQKHCVASYVDSVYQGKTNILFMRDNKDLSKPLYTVEVINHKIVQIRGFANRPVEKIEEKVFVEKYKDFLKELRAKKFSREA